MAKSNDTKRMDNNCYISDLKTFPDKNKYFISFYQFLYMEENIVLNPNLSVHITILFYDMNDKQATSKYNVR